MRILLSATSFSRHEALLRNAAPTAQWVTLAMDGALRLNGAAVDSAAAEVAWLNSEIFQEGILPRFADLVEAGDALRFLQFSGAGLDLPLFRTLAERNVRLATSHVSGPPIADYVLRCALEHLQNAGLWRAAQAEKRWERTEFQEMYVTRWLIIGLGTIGREVAIRARAFGAHVTGVRRTQVEGEPVDALISPSRIFEALPESDIVVLAAPPSSETQNLVDKDFCAAMKAGSALINVGRGVLVDEAALIHGLDSGHPARAFLDVVREEPLPQTHPFWTHESVILTAHTSALGSDRHTRAAEVFAENLLLYAAGKKLNNEAALADLPAAALSNDFVAAARRS